MEHETTGQLEPIPWEVITVSGRDASDYLQGQISQDVATLENDMSRWSFALNPTGKVIGFFRITRVEDDQFLIDTAAGSAKDLVARLERFRLRLDVGFELGRWWLVRCRGEQREVGTEERRIRRDWLVAPGWDRLSPVTPSIGVSDVGDWERIASGIPEPGRDLPTDGSVIPAELGAQLLDAAVDFDKGCYTGQELVLRMHARGDNAPKRFRIIEGDTGPAPSPGAQVDDEHGTIGVMTSVAVSPSGGWLGLARLPRRIEIGARVCAGGADNRIPATVRSRPADAG